MIELIAFTLIGAGVFFLIVGAIGVIRLPDFFCRLHSAGKCDTLGQALVLIGLILYEGASFVSLKMGLIIVFIAIANPTATHSLAKAGYGDKAL
jgi:multicomponent Na+:H+ antiporter subunit G